MKKVEWLLAFYKIFTVPVLFLFSAPYITGRVKEAAFDMLNSGYLGIVLFTLVSCAAIGFIIASLYVVFMGFMLLIVEPIKSRIAIKKLQDEAGMEKKRKEAQIFLNSLRLLNQDRWLMITKSGYCLHKGLSFKVDENGNVY